MNKIARVIYDSNKDGESIKANIRLRKNGHFSSVEGVVEDIKVSREGFPYIVIQKDSGWQNVRLGNVMSVVKGEKTYKNS